MPAFEDVREANARISSVINKTPVVTSRSANELAGAEIFFKVESFQRGGAFKFRGAYNALSQLEPGRARRGVLTFSSGNHAAALALAGRLLGIHVVIVMPDDAPRVKLDATKSYGGEVVLYDREETTREALGKSIAADRDLTIVPPYDHPDIVAGAGTAALELLEEVGTLDALLVPCGGGGLLAGSALAARQLSPACRIVGVEPEAADDGARSFRSGKLQTVVNPQTIADGARTPSLGPEVTFPLILNLVDAFVTVNDDQLLSATKWIWERMKLVVEPTGALAAAAAFERKVDFGGKRVGIIVSGGNADLSLFGRGIG